jgi:nanoRNase/pAp phosphatase (c-di-AMP/oligoRNAs hydrolase)
MELVFAHNNMDFDSLSAQFALTKLYPSCKMVLGYPLTGNLRSFHHSEPQLPADC